MTSIISFPFHLPREKPTKEAIKAIPPYFILSILSKHPIRTELITPQSIHTCKTVLPINLDPLTYVPTNQYSIPLYWVQPLSPID